MLSHKTYLIKEHVSFLHLSDTYDILDPATGAPLGTAREAISGFMKFLRLLVHKRLLPTRVEVRSHQGNQLVLAIHRRGLFRSTVTVHNGDGKEIGVLKSKLFSLGGGFHVLDTAGTRVAEVKGDWKGWNFRFLTAQGVEIGTVTKKWAGIGKELFTTADNYVIALDESRELPPGTAALLLAAGLAIDVVFKEK